MKKRKASRIPFIKTENNVNEDENYNKHDGDASYLNKFIINNNRLYFIF